MGRRRRHDVVARIGRLTHHPLVRYVAIGGLSFVVDAGLLWLATSVLGWPVWAGATLGYWTGVVVNFTLNRLLLGRREANLLRQTVRYGILLGANYVVTLTLLHLASTWGIPVVVAKSGIVAASTCWNYLLYRAWVFA